jgi:hypothetical protein
MRLALFLILLVPTLAYSEIVVLNAVPDSKVISSSDGTERITLSQSQRNEFRLLITQKNGKYFWSTRENKELILQMSGAVHIFIEPGGAGYIEVFDTTYLPKSAQPEGKRYLYKEHLRNFHTNITYWGQADEFNP